LGDTTQSYGEAVSNAEGRLAFVFPMPNRWPNGSPITEKALVLVVANQDFSDLLRHSGNRMVDTTLAKENGVWVITKFQPVTP
jgi:hypothetical protein